MATTNLVGALLLILGVIASYFSYKWLMEKKRSENWIQVDAQILSSSIKKQSDEDSGTSYDTYLDYEYEINGQLFRNSGTIRGDTGKKKQIKERYAPGQSVNVYYNPENHPETVLVAGIQMLNLIILMIPAILIITGFSYAF